MLIVGFAKIIVGQDLKEKEGVNIKMKNKSKNNSRYSNILNNMLV